MGLFGTKKDWNVIAIIFERKDMYQVNGNRGKGADAEKVRDGAKKHTRTILWAVFDQKGAVIESAPGPGHNRVPNATLARLERNIHTLKTVRDVLRMLESGKTEKAAKPLEWNGYPTPESTDDE
jgi:hypothetical protein